MLVPDVAVIHKRAWSTEDAADRDDAPEMTALYVFVRRKGRWWIIRRKIARPSDELSTAGAHSSARAW